MYDYIIIPVFGLWSELVSLDAADDKIRLFCQSSRKNFGTLRSAQCIHLTSPLQSPRSYSRALDMLLFCQRRQVVLECLYRCEDWLKRFPHLRHA